MQTPIEAEELLAILHRSIAQTSTVLRSDSAVHYVGGADRLRIAYEAVKAEAAVFGSSRRVRLQFAPGRHWD